MDWGNLAIVVLSAAAGAFGKTVGESVVSRFSPTKRLKKAEEAERSRSVAPARILTPELMLQSKEVELICLRDELLTAQAALRRLRADNEQLRADHLHESATRVELERARSELQQLRTSRDGAALEMAKLQGELQLARAGGEKLVRDMEELLKNGPPSAPAPARVHTRTEAVDARFAVERVRSPKKDHKG